MGVAGSDAGTIPAGAFRSAAVHFRFLPRRSRGVVKHGDDMGEGEHCDLVY